MCKFFKPKDEKECKDCCGACEHYSLLLAKCTNDKFYEYYILNKKIEK